MRFKKKFKTLFVWRRNCRSIIRSWKIKTPKKISTNFSRNYFSWKHQKKKFRHPNFYLRFDSSEKDKKI